jgi:hypothetical protein
MHQMKYARLANKEYSPEALDDEEVVISVTGYHEDEEIANKQERVVWEDMEAELEKQYGANKVNFPEMGRATIKFLSELFQYSGRSIGQWPNSSAYYGVDVIYDASELVFQEEQEQNGDREAFITPQPKLIEVNFLGDWHGMEVAAGKDVDLYYQFANDTLLTLATDCDLECYPRLIPLHNLSHLGMK